jgi:quercetin dioxygenase-like cupin family protein
MDCTRRRFFQLVASALILTPLLLNSSAVDAAQSEATPAPTSNQILAETTVAALPPPPSVVALVRITLAPAEELTDLSVAGPELIAVESGTLNVSMPGDEDEAEEVLERVRRGGTPVAEEAATPVEVAGRFVFNLAPGDSLFVPGDTPHSIWNAAQEPAVFLAAAVTPQPASAGPPTWPPGSSDELPAGADIELLDVGYSAGTSTTAPAHIELVRMSGVTGEIMPRHQAGGPELFVVEDGTLEVDVVGGAVEVRDTTSSRSETIQVDESAATPTGVLSVAGGAVLLQPGTIATIRNGTSAPLTVLVLTVLPA